MNGLEVLEQRGRNLEKIEIVQKMIEAGFSVDEIVNATQIDRDFVQTIADGGVPEIPEE